MACLGTACIDKQACWTEDHDHSLIVSLQWPGELPLVQAIAGC